MTTQDTQAQVPTATQPAPAVSLRQGNSPHTAWINLYGDQRWYECAIMKEVSKNTYRFIQINKLDRIDQQRLARIVHSPRAASHPLYDLMAQTTLQNGMNALKYFDQFVEVLAPDGKIFRATNDVHVAGVMYD